LEPRWPGIWRGCDGSYVHGVDEPLLGVTEIARRVGLHKSTVSRTLPTLERVGLVERDPGSGCFQLGIGVIGVTGPLLANLDVCRVALSALAATRRTRRPLR
jgi:IclR family transcriptional regulator, acetate operon repressor